MGCDEQKSIIVIGSGASVKQYPVEEYQKFATIGMNHGILYHDWYTHYTAVDTGMVNAVKDKILSYSGKVWLPLSQYVRTCFSVCQLYKHFFDTSYIMLKTAINLAVKSSLLTSINIAYMLGYNPIYLIGFDGYATHTGGRWFNDEETRKQCILPEFNADAYTGQLYIAGIIARQFRLEGIKVINLNYLSRCTSFEFGDLPI